MECPETHPNPCDNGHEMRLKYRRADGSPFYCCDCKPAHFRNPEKEWTKPANTQSGNARGASASICTQFCCAACGALNDVQITATEIKQPAKAQTRNDSYPEALGGNQSQSDPREQYRR